MHILTDFLNRCVPDDVHPLYNQAMDIMIKYRDSTNYDILNALIIPQTDPYPSELRDEINVILTSSLSDIIHDHGLIAEGELDQLVKLAQSLKALTDSPDLDIIDNAMTAFPDNIKDCMQRVLEGHGGLDEFEFSQMVKLVAPTCRRRLEQHAMRTQELLDIEIADLLDEDENKLSLDVLDEKRNWLIQARNNNELTEIVLHYVVEMKGSIGRPLDELTTLLRSDIIALQPSNPLVAARTLIALSVLSDAKMSEIGTIAKSHVEQVFDDMNFIIATKAHIDEITNGG